MTDDRNRIAVSTITHRPLDGHHRVREEDEFIFDKAPQMPDDDGDNLDYDDFDDDEFIGDEYSEDDFHPEDSNIDPLNDEA